MSILVFALIVLIVVGLLIWATDLIPMPAPLNVIIKVAIVLIGVVLIVQRTSL